MSEDRLDRALQHMKEEDMDAGTLESARARVWENLANVQAGVQATPLMGTLATCAEFGPDLRAYARHELSGSRRLLVEDHLGRCARCRAELAGIKGDSAESSVVAMPRRRVDEGRVSAPWARRALLAAAAAMFFAVLYLGRDAIDGVMAPGGPRATVVAAEGLYRLPEGALQSGAAVNDHESIRTGPGAHAVLRLADGSMVSVNERTELFVTAAWSGQAIHLQRGDIIVKAAKQRRGHLRVLTRDSIASVKGTIFAVSAGMGGSVVSVVEGSVEVNQPGREVLLRPGQQAASMPALTTSVAQAISWSPDAPEYLALLGSLANIERELASFPTELRMQSSMLPYLPAGAVVYGTVSNPDVTIARALSLADDQSAQNAAFGAWWNSETGQQLRQMTERLQSVNRLLGDEVVFCVSVGSADGPVPIVMARVKSGMRAPLTSALEGLFAAAGETPAAYSVTDDLMVVSNSASHVTWVLSQLSQGAGSPFAAVIGERYRRGVGWLIAIDAPAVVAMTAEDDAPPIALAGMIGMKYVFLEQRAPAGALENEVTFAFGGPRTGMGSWLADAGSGGAAEYLPADALVAGYVSTREPFQLFQELTAQLTRLDPAFESNLATFDEKLGTGFVQNLTAALGTEAAIALTGFSTSGPTWVMAALTNDPAVIDSSVQKLVEAFNADLAEDEQSKRIALTQESAGGRTWHTMRPAGLPVGITWTYDQGYMVAGSDRGVAERAIATRNGGSPLVWSPAFLGQLPSSAGLHPSAFGWVNTRGALGVLSGLVPNPALGELLASRDPILVVFDGKPDVIHGASRTRITGMIMDAMLLESLSRATEAQPSTVVVSQ
jgi:hypothetical protein